MHSNYTGKRDPINCPANQPNPTRDYHDVPFPEGTQPASGEWTVYSVMKLRQKHWHEEDKNNAVAIAHNVALAAERTRSRTFSGKVIEFQKQLAAERYERCCDQKNHDRELAAERDKTKELRRLLDAAGCSVIDEE
jgi:GAF domain-containing protein